MGFDDRRVDLPTAAVSWSKRLAVAVLVFAIANLCLGWGLGLLSFTRGRDGLAAMVPETAFGFALLATSQVIYITGIARRYLSLILAGLVPCLAILFVIYPDALYTHDQTSDRMSVATGVILSALALAQIGEGRSAAAGGWGPALLALVTLALGCGGLAAFAFDTSELERYTLFRGLSVLTSSLTCVMALSVLSAMAHLPVIGTVFSDTPGGRLVRGLIAPAVLLPLGLTLAGDLAADQGWLGREARLAVLTVALVGITTGFVLIVGFYQDVVSDREHQALELLEEVLDGLDAGIVVLGAEGQTVLSNPRFGQLAGSLTVRDWQVARGFVSPDEGAPLVGRDNPVRLALARAGPQIALWAPSEGDELVLQFLAFDAGPDSGGRARQVLIVNDLTAAWQQRATMAQTERLNAVGQLAAGVAHEITNIFGIIKLAVGTAELIAPTAAPDQYHAIVNACRRGGSLAERLQRLSVTTVGVDRAVDAINGLSAAITLAERGLPPAISLSRDLPEGPVMIRCDPIELEMALLNLVLNARNAMQDSGVEAGTISVKVAVDTAWLTLTVTDDGPGIPEALQDKVREPFFTTRGAQGGTGFGLALVDTFASRTGGVMEIASAPNQGTEVTVRLPRLVAPDAEPEPGRPNPVSLKGLRILVVEDDRELKGMVSGSLTALKAEAEVAPSGEAAMAALTEGGGFDALVTAVNISGALNGGDLAHRAMARDPKLAVVFVTADRDAAVDLPLPGPVLLKPVNLGVLSTTIAQAVAARQDRE